MDSTRRHPTTILPTLLGSLYTAGQVRNGQFVRLDDSTPAVATALPPLGRRPRLFHGRPAVTRCWILRVRTRTPADLRAAANLPQEEGLQQESGRRRQLHEENQRQVEVKLSN